MLNTIQRVNDGLGRACIGISTLIVGFAVFAYIAAAAERYIWGFGLSILNDLPPLLMPWAVFLCMGVLFRLDRHIAVDVLPILLPPRGRNWMHLVLAAITLGMSVVFLLGGAEALTFFQRFNQMTETEPHFPLWWVFLSFPVGFALLGWFAFERLLLSLRDILTGTGGTA
jgi:C4-dicarboxylate transporter DctQ subunit